MFIKFETLGEGFNILLSYNSRVNSAHFIIGPRTECNNKCACVDMNVIYMFIWKQLQKSGFEIESKAACYDYNIQNLSYVAMSLNEEELQYLH